LVSLAVLISSFSWDDRPLRPWIVEQEENLLAGIAPQLLKVPMDNKLMGVIANRSLIAY
jgi:hypothetical protein